MAPEPGLLLVRHGATAHNDPGDERLRGWLDIALATSGIVAARHAAREILAHKPTRLYTSDLTRSLDTAKIMSVTLGITPLRTKDLRPWDLGTLAGQRVADALPLLELHSGAKRNEPLPGAHESFAQFIERIRATVTRLLQLSRRTQETIVAVTHARTLYALQEILFGEPIPVKGPPAPGAVVRLAGPVGRVNMTTVYPGRDLHDSGVS